MVSTFKANRISTAVAAAVIGAAVFCGGSASASDSPNITGERHVIKVTTSPKAQGTWSVYGNLKIPKGKENKNLYHWEETGKKGGKGYVRWEFTDRGQGGWIDIRIDASPSQAAHFYRLPLNKNHCFYISDPRLGYFSTVKELDSCPFNGR